MKKQSFGTRRTGHISPSSSVLHNLGWMSPVLKTREQEGSSFADGLSQPISQPLLCCSKHSSPKPLCLPTTDPWSSPSTCVHPPRDTCSAPLAAAPRSPGRKGLNGATRLSPRADFALLCPQPCLSAAAGSEIRTLQVQHNLPVIIG